MTDDIDRVNRVTFPQLTPIPRNEMYRTAWSEVTAEVMANREEILRAFIAKYGCEPDEIMQYEQLTANGMRWYVQHELPEGRKELEELRKMYNKLEEDYDKLIEKKQDILNAYDALLDMKTK